jgi:hypothetical protein
MLRSFRIDPMLASFQGSIAHGVARSVAPSLARSMAQSMAQSVAPSLARSVTPSMARSIESLRSAAMSSLSSSITQSFEVHGLDPAHSASWSLRRVPSVRTPALQSFLKAATRFGPIVVTPDYEDDELFDYHPDLGWLLPETAAESRDAIDVEELWNVVVAFAQGIAVDHRTKVLLSMIGEDGRSFLVQVAGTVAGGLILYWILHH